MLPSPNDASTLDMKTLMLLIQDDCPETLRSPDSAEQAEEYERQALLDKIMREQSN